MATKAPKKADKKTKIYDPLKAEKMFKPTMKENDEGEAEYTLHCTCNAKAKQLPCSQAMYNKAMSKEFHKMYREDFTLGVNIKSGMVDYIEYGEQDDFFSTRGGTRQSTNNLNEQDQSSSIPYIIYSLMNPDAVEVKAKPNNVNAEAVEEIRSFLADADEPVQMHDLLCGKYLVTDIRQGGELIYVDPVER